MWIEVLIYFAMKGCRWGRVCARQISDGNLSPGALCKLEDLFCPCCENPTAAFSELGEHNTGQVRGERLAQEVVY